ncbi:hypothetical protein OH76DRAFT_1359427 [Lentinus brumalis]|uniref:Uncharacterized protein n=1 Tax=Lentinus brumalis TaxID=2498619 RepID=A0A371CWB4_9APHY|nr:hypothetical protein OH76DRAFT_1359427 [Polyporus brumalis]
MVSSSPTLFALRPSLQDYLLKFVDLRSLQAFRSVSPLADRVVSAHLTRYLKRSVNPFVADADAFLHFLDSADAVISGSAAAAVLLRTRWVNTDLDVYASYEAQPYVVAYLLENEGYVLRDGPPGIYYEDAESGPATISTVTRLRKGELRVDVIQSRSSSTLLPIAGFWCSALMNFVSLRWYCLAYAELAESGHSLLAPSRLLEYRYPSPRTLTLMTKYRARGFDFRLHALAWRSSVDITSICPGLPSATCPFTPRFFGDVACVSGSVLTYATLATHPFAHEDTRESVSWVRGGHACGPDCSATTDFLDPLISALTLVQVEAA